MRNPLQSLQQMKYRWLLPLLLPLLLLVVCSVQVHALLTPASATLSPSTAFSAATLTLTLTWSSHDSTLSLFPGDVIQIEGISKAFDLSRVSVSPSTLVASSDASTTEKLKCSVTPLSTSSSVSCARLNTASILKPSNVLTVVLPGILNPRAVASAISLTAKLVPTNGAWSDSVVMPAVLEVKAQVSNVAHISPVSTTVAPFGTALSVKVDLYIATAQVQPADVITLTLASVFYIQDPPSIQISAVAVDTSPIDLSAMSCGVPSNRGSADLSITCQQSVGPVVSTGSILTIAVSVLSPGSVTVVAPTATIGVTRGQTSLFQTTTEALLLAAGDTTDLGQVDITCVSSPIKSGLPLGDCTLSLVLSRPWDRWGSLTVTQWNGNINYANAKLTSFRAVDQSSGQNVAVSTVGTIVCDFSSPTQVLCARTGDGMFFNKNTRVSLTWSSMIARGTVSASNQLQVSVYNRGSDLSGVGLTSSHMQVHSNVLVKTTSSLSTNLLSTPTRLSLSFLCIGSIERGGRITVVIPPELILAGDALPRVITNLSPDPTVLVATATRTVSIVVIDTIAAATNVTLLFTSGITTPSLASITSTFSVTTQDSVGRVIDAGLIPGVVVAGGESPLPSQVLIMTVVLTDIDWAATVQLYYSDCVSTLQNDIISMLSNLGFGICPVSISSIYRLKPGDGTAYAVTRVVVPSGSAPATVISKVSAAMSPPYTMAQLSSMLSVKLIVQINVKGSGAVSGLVLPNGGSVSVASLVATVILATYSLFL